MNILVTGGSGQVGQALQRAVWPQGVCLDAPPRARLDLARPDTVAALLAERAYTLVINAGAYTAVDKCQTEVTDAWTVNALAPAALAQATLLAAIPIIHISTDYVFDGGKQGAYHPNDAIRPLNVYGASKAGGELAVRTGNPRHIILRTSWVVSADGSNFIKTMLRHGATRPLMRVVADQHGAPTGADDLAAAIVVMAMRLIGDPQCSVGTYHFSNAGATTWFGFAREIFAQSAARGGPNPQIEAITTADYPLPAARPKNSVLDCSAVTQDFGIVPPPWQSALAAIMDQLLPARA